MSRTSRSTITSGLSALALFALLGALFASTGCKQLDARTRIRKGNAMFKEADYDGAVAEYEAALKELDSPTLHYNLGLTYTKLFKPGSDTPENKALGDKIATEFNAWLAANPTDTPTRDLMTQVWLDAGEYPKALEYWTDQLKQAPANTEIMGKLAGINLKAGNWRESMEWYDKVADAQTEPSGKVLAFQSIGNVAWAKLNSKTVNNVDRIEIADRGIGALEQAAAISPNNLKNHGLIASIYNFRSLAQGASWASALDRATSQDHSRMQRVLSDEAKKAQALENPTAPPAPAPATGSGTPATGSAATPAAGSAATGSATGTATGSGSSAPAATTPATKPVTPPASAGGTPAKAGG